VFDFPLLAVLFLRPILPTGLCCFDETILSGTRFHIILPENHWFYG